jgi:hypothetical protein
MRAVAQQLSATRLAPGRWRVELEFTKRRREGEPPPRPHRRELTLRSGPKGAEIESLAIGVPSAPRRFSVILAAPESGSAGAAARFELGGPGWTAEIELPEAGPAPAPDLSRPSAIDYMARDFDALRTMLLAVIDERAGQSLSDHPVSQTAALAEELAYLGDALSYSQDGIATEAYLASARRRISVTRHAELLDYQVGTGQSARVWVRFEVEQPLELPARTQLLAGAADMPPLVSVDALPAALAAGAVVFETLDPISLEPDQPPYQLASIHHAAAQLAPGATKATVVSTAAKLKAGELILIEPVNPLATRAGQVVRLTQVSQQGQNTVLEWDRTDAIAADEALTGTAVHLRAGNLVLAEQAQTHDWAKLPPPVAGARYWPQLPVAHPAFRRVPRGDVSTLSAADALAAAGAPVLPAVQLQVGPQGHERDWTARRSLLDSGPFDPGFVVEVEDDGTAHLRFGDGTNGMRPPVNAAFQVMVRSGGGSVGNVGIGAIAHVVGARYTGLRVRNPVRAVGGADPEPLAQVRLYAPTAFRITDRAVTADQYTAAARELPGVADAATRIVPTGAGPLARVRVYAGDWTAPTAPLVEQVRAALERRRPVGVALDVQPATASPVTIVLDVVADPEWMLAALAAEVESTLEDQLLGAGRFGFATRLHRSQLITWLTPLAGVLDVTLSSFSFTGDAQAPEALVPRFGHIIRIDNDPAAPQRGSVSFRLRTEDS